MLYPETKEILKITLLFIVPSTVVVIYSTRSSNPQLLNPCTSEKSSENLSTKWTQRQSKGSVVKQSGNDVEGCRFEKVLFQSNMRLFQQYSVNKILLFYCWSNAESFLGHPAKLKFKDWISRSAVICRPELYKQKGIMETRLEIKIDGYYLRLVLLFEWAYSDGFDLIELLKYQERG